MTNRAKILIVLILLIILLVIFTRTRSFEIQNVIASPAFAAQEQILNFGSYGEDVMVLSQNALWGEKMPFSGVEGEGQPIPRLAEENRLERQNLNAQGYLGERLDLIKLAHSKVVEKWGEGEWQSLYILILKESGWRLDAINPFSGACGLFQFLPCGKMNCDLEDAECQIDAGLNYIKGRYQNPTNALRFWQENNWY